MQEAMFPLLPLGWVKTFSAVGTDLPNGHDPGQIGQGLKAKLEANRDAGTDLLLDRAQSFASPLTCARGLAPSPQVFPPAWPFRGLASPWLGAPGEAEGLFGRASRRTPPYTSGCHS